MWSTSQRSAGSSHPEGCWQCRSRTSIARRRAPVKVRRRDTDSTRAGPSAGGTRPGGHLDQGVGAALPSGAHRPVAFVLSPLVFHQPVQLGHHHRPAERVQHGAQVDHRIERRRHGGADFVAASGFVVAAGGVGALLPVLDDLTALPEPQQLGLFDQRLFMRREDHTAPGRCWRRPARRHALATAPPRRAPPWCAASRPTPWPG